MKISIIITSYNSEKTIGRCLETVFSQSYKGEYEVIVVDSSKDTTPVIVRNKFPQTKLIHLQEKKLPGEALNIGLKQANGEIIAFIPSDCIAHRDWIKNKIPYLNNGYTAVAGAIGNASKGSLIGWLNFFIEHTTNSPGRPGEDFTGMLTHGLTYWRNIYDIYGPYISGTFGAEDDIFNVKLARAREPVFFEPESLILHINTDNIIEFIFHQFRHGRSYALAYRRGLISNPRFKTKKSIENFLHIIISYPVFWLRWIWRCTLRWTPGLVPLLIFMFPLLSIVIYACVFGVIKGIFFYQRIK